MGISEGSRGEKEKMSWRSIYILMIDTGSFLVLTEEQWDPGSRFKITHLNFQNNMI